MSFPLRPLTKNRYIAICSLCSVIALAALSVLGMRMTGSLTANANNPASAQNKTPPPIKVISITVNPRGFNPSRITVPEGFYLIDINNRSGFPELSNSQFGNSINRCNLAAWLKVTWNYNKSLGLTN
jgi:hypothetical protein